MVEAGAIPALLRHLSTDSLPIIPLNQASREEEAMYGRHGAGDVHQMAEQHPSLLLAARLLHAFSSEPDVRCALICKECVVVSPCLHVREEAAAEAGGG